MWSRLEKQQLHSFGIFQAGYILCIIHLESHYGILPMVQLHRELTALLSTMEVELTLQQEEPSKLSLIPTTH